MTDPKEPDDNDKLPRIDETSVDVIPGADLDEVSGGFLDIHCNCTFACTATKVKPPT